MNKIWVFSVNGVAITIVLVFVSYLVGACVSDFKHTTRTKLLANEAVSALSHKDSWTTIQATKDILLKEDFQQASCIGSGYSGRFGKPCYGADVVGPDHRTYTMLVSPQISAYKVDNPNVYLCPLPGDENPECLRYVGNKK